MLCYRRFAPIHAISFDLDDTLYENGPILCRAEQAQLTQLHQNVPQTLETDINFWMSHQRKYAKDNPKIAHNMVELRQQGIYHGLLSVGLPDKDAHLHAEKAYNAFYQERIRVDVAPEVKSLLENLKSSYPLVALTNGTADIDAMGLGDVFEFTVYAGQSGNRQKPAPDMYHAAAKQLDIEPKNLMHVGDSLHHDIKGALDAGCSAMWVNLKNETASTASALPHIEITDIQALQGLV